MMTTLREDAKYSQSSNIMKTVLDTAAGPAAIQAQNVPLVWPHSSHLCYVSRYAIDKGKARFPIKKSGHQSRHLKCSMISDRRFFLLDKIFTFVFLSLSYDDPLRKKGSLFIPSFYRLFISFFSV